jgi:lipoprotein-releasing system permease protein
MNLSTQIAWRYLFAGRKRFAAFITWISVAGLALGVIVLTVVVSVMNGFDRELRTRLLGTIPHLLVEAPATDSAAVLALGSRPDVARAFKFFSGSGMVTQNGAVNPVSIYALDEAGIKSLTAPGALFRGSGLERLARNSGVTKANRRQAQVNANALVMGAPLARHLGLYPGDTLIMVLSEPTATGINPKLFRFQLLGTFEIGAELDSSLVFTNLARFDDSQWSKFGKLGWRVDLVNPMQARALADQLSLSRSSWQLQSWDQTYGEFFRAVALEKSMMFLVLLMVVAVASFNIVSGQLMVVTEKRGDIAILRTMGADAGLIRRVFILQGVFIASIGIVGGLLLGVLAALNVAEIVRWLGSISSYRLLEGSYFSALPSVVKPMDLLVIAGMAWSLCVLAAWLPARRAANLNPVQALHLN